MMNDDEQWTKQRKAKEIMNDKISGANGEN